MDKNSIFVVTHKKFTLPLGLSRKGYTLISVGNANNNSGFHDNVDDNIAKKNSTYCELTALYWIWKNYHSQLKGICHYRRYFTYPTFRFNVGKVLGMSDVEKILDKHSIIMPERRYYSITSEELYLKCGKRKDLKTTRDVLQEYYPEYVDYWDKMLSSNNGYLANMMICHSNIFDNYCEWLFDVLSKVECRTDLSGYSTQEKRIYGYISERLLDVWIAKNKLKVIEFPIINPETDHGLKFFLYCVSRKLDLYSHIKTLFFNLRIR